MKNENGAGSSMQALYARPDVMKDEEMIYEDDEDDEDEDMEEVEA